MSDLKIYTNNKPRPIVYHWELDEATLSKFGYENVSDESNFFWYKGELYCLDDFMDLTNKFYYPNGHPFGNWHGYLSDSFFSGTLVRLCENDIEMIVVGWYCS